VTETHQIKVQVELNGLRHVVEGDSDQVIREVIQFISRVCPPFDIASRLVWSPDYAKMLETISKLAKISSSGEIIITELVPSADQAIGLVLLCTHVANKFGKRMNDEMSVEEISSAAGKAVKTVRNTLVEMVKAGLVERTGRGTYKISTNGLIEVQEAAKELGENETPRISDAGDQ
jgi:DNA-binding transcriptional ArsR family regulator